MMKRKMGMPHSRPLADFLPTISIKAKDFAAEMTSVTIQTKDYQGENAITKEHVDNNAEVRKTQTERGIVPENLPAADDVKKENAKEEKEARAKTVVYDVFGVQGRIMMVLLKSEAKPS